MVSSDREAFFCVAAPSKDITIKIINSSFWGFFLAGDTLTSESFYLIEEQYLYPLVFQYYDIDLSHERGGLILCRCSLTGHHYK